MKKWIVVALILLTLTGCSWRKVLKWFNEMEWERDDRVVRIVDILIK